MSTKLVTIALVVRDYDEAIAYYVGRLGFHLVEDTALPEPGKRWVIVRPDHDGSAALLLARASNAEQESAIGNQTGGRVFLFLETDDFEGDFDRFRKAGVDFIRPPQRQPYGMVAVFRDLYGNLWDLVEYD